MSQEIVKITSKGQLTIPLSIRTEAGLEKGSYLYMKSLGGVVIMKKVGDLTLDEVSTILGELAKEKGVTRQLLAKEIKRIRGELWRSRYAKGEGAS
jgi:AbrB family looped-hinge helix DNA binding protein